jgi:RNA polymerase sigma-70 factor (ECF subfamily)
VELYTDEVWRFASSQVSRREDAEDIVMEVFAVAIAKFHKVAAADSQRNWLLAIARRKAADSLRKHYRRAERPIADTEIAAEESSPGERQEATRVALQELPAAQSQALLLKYVNGLSTEEVGRVIGKSAAATNSLLQRARVALRTALTPVFPDEVSRES